MRKVVFIGAPRAGKTTLMAAWLNYLKEEDNVEVTAVVESGYHGTAKIESVWQDIAERGREPDQTVVGLALPNEIHFTFHGRQYILQFFDYSGETASGAFTGELNDEELSHELIANCADADRLFLVVNLEDYATENNNSLKDVFILLHEVAARRELRRVLKYGVTVYLSHPDRIAPELVERHLSEIRARIREAAPGFPDRATMAGTVVKAEADGTVRFSDRDAPFSPRRHFAEWFAEIVRGGRSKNRDPLALIWNMACANKFRVALFLLIAAALASLPFIRSWQQERQVRSDWIVHLTQLEAYEARELNDQTHARQLRDDLGRWTEVARESYESYFLGEEIDQRVGALQDRIEEYLTASIKGEGELKEALRTAYGSHYGDIERLYRQVEQAADQAVANPEEWESATLEEWRRTREFIGKMREGVTIEISQPSFWFDDHYTLLIELHIVREGELMPWGDDRVAFANIQGVKFGQSGRAASGGGRSRYIWQETKRTNRRFYPGRDQIFLRVVRNQLFWGDSEITVLKVAPKGIHYFGLFDAEFQAGSGNKKFDFNFTNYRLFDGHGNEIEVPAIIREVSP